MIVCALKLKFFFVKFKIERNARFDLFDIYALIYKATSEIIIPHIF